MTFYVFGCSHREASVDLRQRLAISAEETEGFLNAFRTEFPETEVVALSTCNRVEIYSYIEESQDELSSLSADEHKSIIELYEPISRQIDFLADNRNIDRQTVRNNCFQYRDREALEHLFKVASSLDSMALGDMQIISQVRNAHDWAVEAKSVGMALNLAFQTAVKIAKRVDSETEIHRHRTSIASIAVKDFAHNIFEDFANKNVLVIGAGEMAEETLEYLKEDGAKSICIVNRTLENARQLAESKGGIAVEWSKLEEQLLGADLIITAVGRTEPVLTTQMFRSLYQHRRRGPLFILDLGVPRNVEQGIEKFPEVYLFSIDDLEKTCQKNRQARERQAPKAYSIIEQETDKFIQDLSHRRGAPILTKLKDDWESIMEAELKRLFNKRPHFTQEDQDAIKQSVERTLNKILNAPYQTLRNESKEGSPGILLESIVKLFRLK